MSELSFREKYGEDAIKTPVGVSRWFRGKPKLERFRVEVYEEHWLCPQDGCDGEMLPNGFVWPTGDPGHHHTCNKCEYTAAIHGRFPRTVHKKVSAD